MNQRIAAATIIRGYGECQAFLNGVKDEEWEKKNREIEKQVSTLREQLRAARSRESVLLEKRRETFLQSITRGPVRRTLRRMLDAATLPWCIFWALNRELGDFIAERRAKYGRGRRS